MPSEVNEQVAGETDQDYTPAVWVQGETTMSSQRVWFVYSSIENRSEKRALTWKATGD